MKFEEIMKNYKSKLNREAFLKSLLCGVTIGLLALTAYMFIDWVQGWSFYWLAAIVFVVITAGVTALFFVFRFRPDRKEIAKRVDALGLEERVLTMNELEGNDSYIAVKQREDTLNALKSVHTGLIKMVVSVPLIIALVVAFVSSAGMVTVSALSDTGVIKPGHEIIDPDDSSEEQEKFFEVTYEVNGDTGGVIEGEPFQIVEFGQSTTPVLAVAEDGFAFLMWSDGSEDPYRMEFNVDKNITLFAIFLPASEGPGQAAGEDGEEGDEPTDAPAEEGQQPSDNEDGDPSTGKGGKYDPANQVYDGETYYGGEVYNNAYDEAIDRMTQNGTMTDEQREIANQYYKIIKE